MEPNLCQPQALTNHPHVFLHFVSCRPKTKTSQEFKKLPKNMLFLLKNVTITTVTTATVTTVTITAVTILVLCLVTI